MSPKGRVRRGREKDPLGCIQKLFIPPHQGGMWAREAFGPGRREKRVNGGKTMTNRSSSREVGE